MENSRFLSLQLQPGREEGEATRAHPSLHAIRKPPAKPWRKPEPPPPKVYQVEPRGFRRLVQRLTGKPRTLLREAAAAPAPLELAAPSRLTTVPVPKTEVAFDHQQAPGGMLSPSFYSSWCVFPLLSPGSMAALES